MAQLIEDMKNLDLYHEDTIAEAQMGFINHDSHYADAGPDENEKTLSIIIEKEDDETNSTSDAEQNVYIFPVREVNGEADSLEEKKDLEISKTIMENANFNILDTLSSLPPVVKCHILKIFLNNCFLKEHQEKQLLLMTNLTVLFEFSAMVRLRTLDGPTVAPSSSIILNRNISHLQKESRFWWSTEEILIWLRTSTGQKLLTNTNLNFNPINDHSTNFYAIKFEIPFNHPARSLLTGTVTKYEDIIEASSENFKGLMGDISLFLNQTAHFIKTPGYTMFDREALTFLGGHTVLTYVFGDDFWEKLDDSHRTRGICQADPQKVILKYMNI